MSILSATFINNTLSLNCSSFSSQRKPCCFCISYKSSRLSVTCQHPPPAAIFNLKNKLICRHFMSPPLSAAAAESVSIDTQTEDSDSDVSKPPVLPQEAIKEVVKAIGKQIVKPRLVLKFIWMEKNIGLGLDQLLPGHGTVPLSPYFFWPRKDAWEELKSVLESKPSISQKKMIILLNQATDIINLWQQSGGNLS